MVDEHVRVEVGFKGGQVVGGFATAATADALERALGEDGARVVVLDTEEGPYTVVVSEVAYLRRFSRAGRVGFTAA
jgi:hypothetical protein